MNGNCGQPTAITGGLLPRRRGYEMVWIDEACTVDPDVVERILRACREQGTHVETAGLEGKQPPAELEDRDQADDAHEPHPD